MGELNEGRWVDDEPEYAEDRAEEAENDQIGAIPLPYIGGDQQHRPGAPGTWQREAPRWLAQFTGGTYDAYCARLYYFLQAPGVPARLDEFSYELLSSYRAMLMRRMDKALRSSRRRRPSPAHTQMVPVTEEGTPQSTATTLALRPGHSWQQQSQSGQGQSRNPNDESAPLSPGSVGTRLSALRQFLRWAHLQGFTPQLESDRLYDDVLKLPKRQVIHQYQTLNEGIEWETFLAAALTVNEPHRIRGRDGARVQRDRTGARTAARDHLMVALDLMTGLRAFELCGLDVGDIVWRRGVTGQGSWWLVLADVKTKGGKGGRTLPLHPHWVEKLEAYLEQTDRTWEDSDTPLFLALPPAAKPPYRITTHVYGEVVRRVLRNWKASGLPGIAGRAISPHSLRHSTAGALLLGNAQQGRPPANVDDVRQWLGHLHVETTQIYLQHLEGEVRRQQFMLNPAPADEADEVGH